MFKEYCQRRDRQIIESKVQLPPTLGEAYGSHPAGIADQWLEGFNREYNNYDTYGLKTPDDSDKEFTVWGVSPGKQDEEILFTKATSMKDAKVAMKILADKKYTKLRIQVAPLRSPFRKRFQTLTGDQWIKKSSQDWTDAGWV